MLVSTSLGRPCLLGALFFEHQDNQVCDNDQNNGTSQEGKLVKKGRHRSTKAGLV